MQKASICSSEHGGIAPLVVAGEIDVLPAECALDGRTGPAIGDKYLVVHSLGFLRTKVLFEAQFGVPLFGINLS